MRYTNNNIQVMVQYRVFLILLVSLWTSVIATSQSVTAVEKVTLTVSDLDRAIDFYTNVLDFQKMSAHELDAETTQKLFGLSSEYTKTQIARLKLGNEMIELMEFSGSTPGRNIPADSRSNDLWFQHIAIVVSDMNRAYRKVSEAKVTHVSTSPQTLPDYIPAAFGITAFYFRDPDGHNLELIHYPQGRGNPQWQNFQEGTLFLGIDHTAIGIEDTDRGLVFYEQLLHLKVGGNSENYGIEQEHLNQVFGARLLITGLHTLRGFGIEFLDYIAPPGGRAYPIDSKPTDLWHWHTTIAVTGIEELRDRIIANGYTLISKGIVQVGDKQALMIRDADGHAILLVQSLQVPPTSM